MTKRKIKPEPAKLCNAATSKFLVACGNPGREEYDGRCKMHRELSPEERTARSAELQAARLAKFAAEEAAYRKQQRLDDLKCARDHFTSAALLFGLASRDAAVTFERFQRLSIAYAADGK